MHRGYASKRVEREGNSAITAVLEFSHSSGGFIVEEGNEPESPLTLALFRSRWLTSYATPCHSRGATFAVGSIYGK